jgi:xylulokinase
MVGGATRSEALRALAPAVLGVPVTLPPPSEYVALGAARQAAWALAGSARPPEWPEAETTVLEAGPTPHVREAYAELRDRTDSWHQTTHTDPAPEGTP